MEDLVTPVSDADTHTEETTPKLDDTTTVVSESSSSVVTTFSTASSTVEMLESSTLPSLVRSTTPHSTTTQPLKSSGKVRKPTTIATPRPYGSTRPLFRSTTTRAVLKNRAWQSMSKSTSTAARITSTTARTAFPRYVDKGLATYGNSSAFVRVHYFPSFRRKFHVPFPRGQIVPKKPSAVIETTTESFLTKSTNDSTAYSKSISSESIQTLITTPSTLTTVVGEAFVPTIPSSLGPLMANSTTIIPPSIWTYPTEGVESTIVPQSLVTTAFLLRSDGAPTTPTMVQQEENTEILLWETSTANSTEDKTSSPTEGKNTVPRWTVKLSTQRPRSSSRRMFHRSTPVVSTTASTTLASSSATVPWTQSFSMIEGSTSTVPPTSISTLSPAAVTPKSAVASIPAYM